MLNNSKTNPLKWGNVGPDDHVTHLVPVAIEIYRNDIVIRYKDGREPEERNNERGECGRWSYHSRRRLMFYAANTDVDFNVMVTLTYPGHYIESDGKLVKTHLNHFLTRCRQRLDVFTYLWFLEWQKRGAPHFHILTPQYIPYEWVAAEWYRIVGSGNEDHLKAGTRIEAIREPDGGKRYAVKYSAKMWQKDIPEGYENVGRMWGCSRDVPPTAKKTRKITGGYVQLYRMLREWPQRGMLYDDPVSLLYGAAGYLQPDS